MEMYDVLSKLKQIENPSEDEQAAIKSAEAMNNPTNPVAKPETVQTPQETAPSMMPETNTVSATGQDVYQPVAEETPVEYALRNGYYTRWHEGMWVSCTAEATDCHPDINKAYEKMKQFKPNDKGKKDES